MISIGTQVPFIRQVADIRVWLVNFNSSGEISMIDIKGQTMAITINLRDSNLSSAGGQHNEKKGSPVFAEGVGVRREFDFARLFGYLQLQFPFGLAWLPFGLAWLLFRQGDVQVDLEIRVVVVENY